ncbi:MAG: hypothetical protein HY861_03260 [Chlamydiia bacterium]|nr:hypothetical protein [Chlamydiia bacterium]
MTISNTGRWVLNVLLDRVEPERRGALESFLPEQERASLQTLSSFEIQEEPEDTPLLLDRIHWSWLLPSLRKSPPSEQKLFLSALPAYACEHLCREIDIEPPQESLREIGKEFLRQTLLEDLTGPTNTLLPLAFLPQSPLLPLLSLDKKTLTAMVDSLSLYDLGAELRQIVETKILKKIYSFLSEPERSFLKQAMTQSPPYPAIRLKLDTWDGTQAALRILLHKRGLARLGVALSKQSADFNRHLCYRFDIGRGAALLRFAEQEAPQEQIEAIVHQIQAMLRNQDTAL